MKNKRRKKKKHIVYTHYTYKKDKDILKEVNRQTKDVNTKMFIKLIRQRVEKDFRSLEKVPLKTKRDIIKQNVRLYKTTSFGKFGRYKLIKYVKTKEVVSHKKEVKLVKGRFKTIIKPIYKTQKVGLWRDRVTGKNLKGEQFKKVARKAYEENIITNIAHDKKITKTQAKRYYERHKKNQYIRLKNIYYKPY